MTERPLAVFDIDGVLADARHRTHFLKPRKNSKGKTYKNWGAFFREAVNDPPLEEGFALLRQLQDTHDIVFLTGRPEMCREDTQTWLEAQGVRVDRLIMRAASDRRRSAEAKAQLLKDLAEEGRIIAIVVEDDETVVVAHRANGFLVRHATWALEDIALKEAQQVDGRV